MKLTNLTIRDAYLAAQQLSHAPLDFEVALVIHDAVEALGAAFRAQDTERAKLVDRYELAGMTDDELNAHPSLQAFIGDYARLLEIEREVPDIEGVEIRPGDLSGVGVTVTGQQIGALRKAGIIRIARPEAKPEAEPQEPPALAAD